MKKETVIQGVRAAGRTKRMLLDALTLLMRQQDVTCIYLSVGEAKRNQRFAAAILDTVTVDYSILGDAILFRNTRIVDGEQELIGVYKLRFLERNKARKTICLGKKLFDHEIESTWK